MDRLRRQLILAGLGLGAGGARAEPDESPLGRALAYPVGTRPGQWYQNPYRVGSWSAMDQVGLPVRRVARGAEVLPLPAAAAAPALQWRLGGVTRTLDDYLERQRTTGLLVLHRGQVVAEHYRYGRAPQARFLSFSMAKSVTSLLVGCALERGAIASLDDPAGRYARDLAGSAYGDTALRHLLRMSSGVAFSERYDGLDDVARLSRAAYSGAPTVLEVLRAATVREAPAGERFAYASAETEVLGRVLSGATGRTVADLTREWLWQPLGAEHDAFWVTTQGGHERVSGYFNATLRDWGRLGLLLAADGRVQGRQVVPRAYLLDATAAARQPPGFRPQPGPPFTGYGYQFWLSALRERTFSAQGIHGQALYVQPASGVVMVHTAVDQGASGRQDPEAGRARTALWIGVLASLGGRTEPI